ncbi:hypothetical protein [Cellulophaga fucicola]|uniref:hypothetical protein n=1 Tax=Cellulophaga fucicola TaxID=76595 RepID=UPI000930034E|nr:hypothetical protein [Cellulophaga fucicola]
MKNKKTIVVKNRVAVTGLVVSVIVTLFYYYKQALLGFPDGHLTTYTRFCKDILFPIYLAINAIFVIVFIVALYKQIKPRLMLILYGGLCVLFLLLEYYFSLHLENGQGG